MDILNESFYLVTNSGFPLIRVPWGLYVCECGWGGLYVCECGWGGLCVCECGRGTVCVNVGGGTVCVCECGWGGLYVCVCVGGGDCVCGGVDRMFEQLGDSRIVCVGDGGGGYVGEMWGG